MNKRMNRPTRRLDWPDVAALALVVASAAVPWLSSNLLLYSVLNQILVAIPASLSIFLMLRMNLVSFAAPAFMAIGGYTASLLALGGVTNVLAVAAASFVAPTLLAIPLGALVLRLRGVYFVLVTYVLTEITGLCLIEFPGLTGGSNGLSGLPALTLANWTFSDNRAVLGIAVALACAAIVIALVTTTLLHRQFNGIRENELLARSLGLSVWRYKAAGFAVAAGLAGIAGFSLVNMLLTANPSSFTSASAVDYVAYAFVGGSGSLLGPVLGTGLLVWAANWFSLGGEFSQGIFGFFIILIVLVAPGGVTGLAARLLNRWRARTARTADTRRRTAAVESEADHAKT